MTFSRSSVLSDVYLKISTSCSNKLHWLPVRQHIHFHILLKTCKYINDTVPEYLFEMCVSESQSENSDHSGPVSPASHI